MTTDAIALLPSTADRNTWDEQQKALMESLGLKGEKNQQRNGSWVKVPFEAPKSIVEAFLYQIRRTNLDPVARQIYCIERGGKWGIQASIDGFRLIAERSNEYRGQTPAQWTDGQIMKVPLRDDGKVVRDGQGNPIMVEDYRWLDVWVAKAPPAAARVGIYRDGFAEPMWAVATYDGYVALDRNSKPTGQWLTNPANQLAKCAEMLGLRKAFPQDLSGLYGTEEMDQAGNQGGSTPPPVARASVPAVAEETPIVPPKATRDWAAEIAAAATVDAASALYREADSAGELGIQVGLAGDKEDGSAFTVMDLFWARKRELEQPVQEPMVDVEKPKAKRRNWLAEGKAAEDRDALRAVWMEASASGASAEVLEQIDGLAASLPEVSEPVPAGEWPQAEPEPEQPEGWAEPEGSMALDGDAVE